MNSYFVKLLEDSDLRDKMLRERPTAFCLLTLVAIRARKTDYLDDNGTKIQDGIEIGEAMIGDFESYGATLQTYRTDKKYLETHKILTYRATNKGTIAKLINSRVFDISRDKFQPANQQTNQQSINKPATTKQEVKKERIDSTTSVELSVNDNENLQVIDSLTSQDISEIAELRSISEQNVQAVFQDLRNYALENKFTYVIKNARKKLEEWVDRQISSKKIKPKISLEEWLEKETGHPVK